MFKKSKIIVLIFFSIHCLGKLDRVELSSSLALSNLASTISNQNSSQNQSNQETNNENSSQNQGNNNNEARGILDPTFDYDGIVLTPISAGLDKATAIALQPDGKILVAGHAHNGSNDDFVVVRYNPDGSLDTSFGSGGKVITPIGTSNDRANAMVLQPDGKILVAGFANNGSNTDFAVVRYNPNGSLDTSFDFDGKVTTHYDGNSDDEAYAIALQPDGKILVAGGSDYYGKNAFAVVRYNSDGSLDTSFGSIISLSGRVCTNISLTDGDVAYAIALQPDGKILVAGYSGSSPNTDFAVVRYNSDGSLDTSFGSGGKVTTSIGSLDYARAIALQPDGKILVAGYSGSSFLYKDFAVVRYNTNGSLDTSFDFDGKVITPVGISNDEAYAIALQPNGKILVAGFAYNGSNTDFAVVRYNTNGSLDTSFDFDGKVITPVGISNNNDEAYAIALQPDGKILAAGYSGVIPNFEFAVVRYK